MTNQSNSGNRDHYAAPNNKAISESRFYKQTTSRRCNTTASQANSVQNIQDTTPTRDSIYFCHRQYLHLNFLIPRWSMSYFDCTGIGNCQFSYQQHFLENPTDFSVLTQAFEKLIAPARANVENRPRSCRRQPRHTPPRTAHADIGHTSPAAETQTRTHHVDQYVTRIEAPKRRSLSWYCNGAAGVPM
ncbi:hypothetical protein [Xanthomonas sp. MUS 060]|uniref:hypothetical protein n=1 Tax=Xanthomonas sp. MUS 060 TaxID=1588031 RepID=UPI00126A46A9|nr:hypothetical protein [Xanthomonas sp. MUS 060]